MSQEDLWIIAEEKRFEYWPEAKLPVDILNIVEIKLKLDVIPVHGLYSDLDTDAWLQRDLKTIVVDNDSYEKTKFENRLRFSLAHELGHYFLHAKLYPTLTFDTVEEWKDFMENIPDAEYSNFEYQANEFAGRFLVPREPLQLDIEKALASLSDNHLMHLLEKNPDAVLSGMAPRLCRPFGVSEEVIQRRLQRERLWPCDPLSVPRL